MIEVRRVRKGRVMDYNIKDAVERITNYCTKNKGAREFTAHDKQVISGHILPLLTKGGFSQIPHTDTTPQPDKSDG